MSTDFQCPNCGAEFDLSVAFSHELDHRALSRLAAVSIPLGARVVKYVGLFAPPKQRLTAAKKIKLILQLLPDLERKAITHKGRDWAVPLEAWAQAFDQMLDARDAQRIELPMKGHGDLYSILAGAADKFEAKAERDREQQQRTAPRRDTVQVRGQPLEIGQALQVTYAGKDPALAKLDQDAANAAPMPQGVRDRLQQIKKGGAQ